MLRCWRKSGRALLKEPADSQKLRQSRASCVQEFINAKDWKTTRQVVEAQQALLFQPEVETLLEQLIAQA